MVSVCSGCNVLHPLSAGLLGIIAGSLYLVTSATMVKIQVDDPVDAVAVHAGSGFLSLMLTPLLRYVKFIRVPMSPKCVEGRGWEFFDALSPSGISYFVEWTGSSILADLQGPADSIGLIFACELDQYVKLKRIYVSVRP